MATTVFILLIIIVFYAYIGYGLILWLINKLLRRKRKIETPEDWPSVTLIIPAYNELYVVDKKMQNTYLLDYPKEKLTIAWITDGSNDGTDEYIRQHYADVLVWHQPERKGKAAALNRALLLAETDYLVFCDANTMLNSEALKNLMKHFTNPKVGVVAGEKRVYSSGDVAGTGESLYWKYESWLKRMNADFYSSIGAVGELFAVKKNLVKPLPEDTIIDDFVLSMQIAHNGYIISYAPDAYATEEPSANEKEEMKRKVRIAAGAFHALFRYLGWLNFFKHPLLSFQYFSHKVIRWLFVPMALLFIFIGNILLVWMYPDALWLSILFALQIVFYSMALVNLFFSALPRIFYLPYYFVMMNYAQFAGFYKYILKKQSSAWEKVKRKQQ